jgi:hypothetical protein
MSTFLALYRGRTIAEARLVAVSADPDLVSDFADRLLQQPAPAFDDPVVSRVERGRREALRLLLRELEGGAGGEP